MSLASMEKHLFNLKFAAKELERSSKKCDKEEKAEKLKLKKAIEKGNMEVARIHAENAIRNRSSLIILIFLFYSVIRIKSFRAILCFLCCILLRNMDLHGIENLPPAISVFIRLPTLFSYPYLNT
jgi:hypothetical protein